MVNLVPSCSVVIPVYNSEQTLEPLVCQLGEVLPAVASDYEVLLINDGSRDCSWEVICELSERFSWVRGINMMRNYGQHNALLCGLRAARSAVVITMDDDLQHPPREIPKLLERLNGGFDVVYGFPRKLPHSLWRNLFSRMTKRTLAFVMGIKSVREISAFRAFRTHLRDAFITYQSSGVIIDVLLSWGTTRFASVEVDEEPRQVGQSNYNFSKLVSQALLILTGYSMMPLRLASYVGFGFTVFGILVFLYTLYVYFLVGSIPGFTFLASIISLFSGFQLFTMGIFGEYLARVFDRSMDRPTYVVGEQVENGVKVKA